MKKPKRKANKHTEYNIKHFRYLQKFWISSQAQEVAYIDKQRNIAISLGERDVKADVKAKNKYEWNS